MVNFTLQHLYPRERNLKNWAGKYVGGRSMWLEEWIDTLNRCTE